MERIKRDRENASLASSDDDEPEDVDNHERAESEPQSHEDELTFECQDCTDEAQTPKIISDPGDPSPEVEKHYQSNHLPFRSWCRCCVLAKAKDSPHRKSDRSKSEDAIPLVGLDFCHPGEEEDGEDKMDVLVVKDFKGKALFSHGCSSKSADEKAANQMVLRKEVSNQCRGKLEVQR